jgi:hypothetical protein
MLAAAGAVLDPDTFAKKLHIPYSASAMRFASRDDARSRDGSPCDRSAC